ncbi:MAG: Gfo/Idh/MocA family oxidoreductase [Clostridia bacterium]|nr:Gfo/Idh/MocA family oxidoreductase [Clostridia bacterium]
MLKIAVVGTGIIGISHLEMMEKTDSCSLCALCDVNEAQVKELAKEKNVPYFTDYKEIPSSVDVDAVILNLPHFLHCEATVFFLEHGVHVLVEKPMANTVEECDKMIEAAEKSGKKLAVGHIQRFFPTTQFVIDKAKSGELGRLCMYSETRSVNYFAETRPKWFLSKEKAGGGIMMNFGAHAFDKIFSVFGLQDVEVASSVANIKNGADIEGQAQFIAKLSDNVSAAVTFCGYSAGSYDVSYYFEKGIIRVSDTCTVYEENGSVTEADCSEYPEFPMLWQLEEFCKYVNGEKSMCPDGHYGRAVIKAVEQVYEKSAN